MANEPDKIELVIRDLAAAGEDCGPKYTLVLLDRLQRMRDADADDLLRQVHERVGEFSVSVAAEGSVWIRWVADHAAKEYEWKQARGATFNAALQAVLDAEVDGDAQ